MNLYGSGSLGSFEELHRKVRELAPTPFYGVKVSLMNQMGNRFQVQHHVTLPPLMSEMPSGYHFGATAVGTRQVSPEGEVSPVIFGETDLKGNTRGALVHVLGNHYKLRLQGGMQSGKVEHHSATIERRTDASSTGVSLINPTLDKDGTYGGVLSASYLRRITASIDMGAELSVHANKRIQGFYRSVLTGGFRYSSPYNGTFAITANGEKEVHASYYQRAMDNMQLGVELMRNARNEVMTTLAYQLEVSNRFIMRAQFDTNWTATAVIERRLGKTVPFTLTISTVLDCLKSQTGVGIGLNLGGGY